MPSLLIKKGKKILSPKLSNPYKRVQTFHSEPIDRAFFFYKISGNQEANLLCWIADLHSIFLSTDLYQCFRLLFWTLLSKPSFLLLVVTRPWTGPWSWPVSVVPMLVFMVVVMIRGTEGKKYVENSVENMKTNEKYFRVVLFIMLYKVVLTFKFVNESLVCDHLNESYWSVLSCGTVYYAVQGGSNF